MIDTDKYEGHTEGLWCWKDGNIVRKAIGNTPLTDDAGLYLIADKQLIADAPLLLAEVKRLREGIKEQMQFVLDCVGSNIGDLYETIADDLRRLIE